MLSGAPSGSVVQAPPRAAHVRGSLTRSAALQMGPAAPGGGLLGVVTEPARQTACRTVYDYCASPEGHGAEQDWRWVRLGHSSWRYYRRNSVGSSSAVTRWRWLRFRNGMAWSVAG